ncbi:uncharacterized protein ISCGN_010330 [Ixodes scapularis]
MEQAGAYKMYLQSDTGSVPRRSAHRYKQQHLVLNDSARSANAEMLAEAPEPTASPEPALLPASTSLAGWQGDDLGGTANPALKAGPVTFEQNTPTRQPPQPAVSGPTCGDSPQQDPMMQPLFPGALVTHEESLLLLMAHVLRHHGSKEATESLLKLLQCHTKLHSCSVDAVQKWLTGREAGKGNRVKKTDTPLVVPTALDDEGHSG